MKRLNKDARHLVTLTLNGRAMRAEAEPRMLLSDFLRHSLGQTGTHVGCEHGVCGACTVQIDGVAARSCLTLAVQVDGRSVDTVEGLSGSPDQLNDLQAAFRRHHALQCGFCTAGILMSCSDFLQRVPEPNEEQVREMLSGHLCRCTGYTNIVNAVLDVAGERRRRKTEHA
jgi:2-furoyl-CoA dehydrogenase 2Fe-2S iron sulfur subunit